MVKVFAMGVSSFIHSYSMCFGSIRQASVGWKDLIDAESLKKNIYADRLISLRYQ